MTPSPELADIALFCGTLFTLAVFGLWVADHRREARMK